MLEREQNAGIGASASTAAGPPTARDGTRQLARSKNHLTQETTGVMCTTFTKVTIPGHNSPHSLQED